MRFEPAGPEMVERLVEHRTLGSAPLTELEWLVAHGRRRFMEAGEFFLRQGQPMADSGMGLEVVLAGVYAVHVDRGAGSRRVIEWQAGDISGLMPYSRAVVSPGDGLCDTDVEALTLSPSCFPDLVRECPTVTAICVHVMLDRARIFNTSDWQDEKMASLGKLAAGLAHELNNPAAAVARSAKMLQRSIAEADRAARVLALSGLTESQLEAVDRIRDACDVNNTHVSLSPVERADREDRIAEWLQEHGVNDSAVEDLADTAVTLEALDQLATVVQGDALDAALDWVAAGSAIRTLAADTEPMDIEQGLRDTLAILGHKARAKALSVRIDVAPAMPRVNAIGGELNQVWMNLIDNALDAAPLGGNVVITAKPEGRQMVVRVIDDGPGISDENAPRVFDPFFTTKAPVEGTGLGLEVARTRVRGHGGEIDFDSRPGRTEFRVSLPLREAASVSH